MQSEYLTEIYQKPAKNSKRAYDTQDFEQIQKDMMLAQLYAQVGSYYRNLINSGMAHMSFSYVEELGKEYAHVGIYDNFTGEQIL